MPQGQPRWRVKLFLSFPVVLVLGAAAALAFFVAQWSATQSDAYSRAQEVHFVRAQFERRIASITENQQTVTSWTEAQKMIAGARDPKWFDRNLGIWLYQTYEFDHVFLLDEADKPIYVMIGGERADPAAHAEVWPDAVPVIAELRRLRRGSLHIGPALRYLRRLALIDSRPAVISVSPILDSEGNPSGEAGYEPVHVAIRRLDDRFLAEMGRDFLLSTPRFSSSDAVSEGEAAFPINRSNSDLGYMIWRVQRPGAETLKKLWPTLAIAGILITLLGVYLVTLIARAADRVIDTRERLDQLARHDALTGLANRFAFEAALAARSAETGHNKPRFALLYLDLDRFKEVNDLFGHPAGDELLRAVARRLEREVGTSDVVARLGGDEFGILVPKVGSEVHLDSLCRRIVAAMATPFDISGQRVDVGVSIGLALSDGTLEGAESIVRRADKALYRQKRAGRNGYSWGAAVLGEEIGETAPTEPSIASPDAIRALVA
ncbi:MAG: diguanylate cyclase [Fulvimarina manganoxydans]|uniref:diguanylate cyclase domain-containing protein n=1 Tax=Fulvimarina manganoxydans TaxID=937218 RepID=UPI00235672DE|nr:diguanylate cyclase [Fulvimarina manganoxydans]MCK5931572.1 diguanylate cyclase [Fulvimarina manganoxydans]